MCLRSVDTEQRRAAVAEPTMWQLGIAADRRPDLPNAAVRRSAGIASCAPETRGAFPSSLHASQRDPTVLKHRIPPFPLPFLPLLLLRLFSPHRGRRQLHSSAIFCRGQPGVKPQLSMNPFQVSCESWWVLHSQEAERPFPLRDDQSITLLSH